MNTQTPTGPSILKHVWSRRPDKKWGIKAMVSIDLSNDGVPGDGFYSITDDLIAESGHNVLSTKLSLIRESIVPIVGSLHDDDQFECIGTGFFISCSGLLLTAAHVIAHVIERSRKVRSDDDRVWSGDNVNLSAVIFRNQIFHPGRLFLAPIQWAAFFAETRSNPLPIRGLDLRCSSDIAICKVMEIPGGHQPLSLIQPGIRGTGITPGANIYALGYGELPERFTLHPDRLAQNLPGNLGLHVSIGQMIEMFPDNWGDGRQASPPGPCFSFGASIPGGMSGSPIFDREGIYVHGVVSKGLNVIEGESPLAYGSMIAPSMTLPIQPLGANLLQVHSSHQHGMAIINAPDL